MGPTTIPAGTHEGVHVCGICGGSATTQDALDFNKSCLDQFVGSVLPPSGELIDYARCSDCGFTFAPAMCRWTLEQFATRVYNEDYAKVDPEYVDTRPRVNAAELLRNIPNAPASMRHLDFGGGAGLMSQLLFEAGWDSQSYDPFVDVDLDPATLGTFDLVTAFEVFEHVPDVGALARRLSTLLGPEGVLLFTTYVSDDYLAEGSKIDWWYAAPRNGHISLFTRDALARVARRMDRKFASFTDVYHAYWRNRPAWATFLPDA